MTLRENQEKFTDDTLLLFAYIKGNAYTFTYGEVWRHEIMQAWYVENGFSKTMNSNHRKRLAIDLNIFKDGSYITNKLMLQHIGDYWESLSPENKWGGNFVDSKGSSYEDTPHFERRMQ